MRAATRTLGVLLALTALVGASIHPATAAETEAAAVGSGSPILLVDADNDLVVVSAGTPGTVISQVPITGLAVGETILGIDTRPATGDLYGLGSSSRLYRIGLSGVATAVGSGPFTPALSGTSFGFDFNPTVDRIRVTSDTGQNLRLNPVTGATVASDTALAYALGDVNTAATPSVVASGYTNSVVGATSTVLYDIDSGLDVLATQSPPNDGTLNTVGPLGVDTTAVAGFDLEPGGDAVAALTVGGMERLYRIDLATGAASLVGNLPETGGAIVGLALGVGAGTGDGYWLVAADGGVFSYGSAQFFGSAANLPLNAEVVGMVATPSTNGYWQVALDGGVFAYGDAGFFGSAGALPLNEPVVAMAPTPSGNGYWLVATDGGVFSYGDAAFYGSVSGNVAVDLVVSLVATATGRGYWLVDADGDVFAFGDAVDHGDAGSVALSDAVIGATGAPFGGGYHLVTLDGDVLSYGPLASDAGSAEALPLNSPMVGIAADTDGSGYWLVAADGGVFAYGSSFHGSTGSLTLNEPVVGIASAG